MIRLGFKKWVGMQSLGFQTRKFQIKKSNLKVSNSQVSKVFSRRTFLAVLFISSSYPHISLEFRSKLQIDIFVGHNNLRQLDSLDERNRH